jgi:fatty acid desaturase
MPQCSPSTERDFSLPEVRQIIADLFVPKPAIYWADFLLSYAVAMLCFAMVLWMPLGSPQQMLLFVVSGLLFYRISTFTHELVHLPSRGFRVFRVVWNLLYGIPFLMPSFLYYTHLDHHYVNQYGTDRDARYLPLAHRPPRHMVFYVAESCVIPLLALVRFALLVPLEWLSPTVRDWTYRHFSSLEINPRYVRAPASGDALRIIRLQETACFFWCWAVLFVPRIFLGYWPITLVAQAYLTAVLSITVNAVRVLGAHRYTNDGRPMTFFEQTLDTLNFPDRPWITELWGPLGLRFHALHHLFPGLPYHAMPEAHRRLMAHLPADSPYRLTQRVSLTGAIRELWLQAAATTADADGLREANRPS